MIRHFIAAGILASVSTFAYAVPVSPQDVIRVLKANGATDVSSETDEDGNGVEVYGTINDVNFIANAIDCNPGNTSCKAILFFANFDLDRAAMPEDYVKANEYNDGRTWGRAYVLDDQIGIDYAVDLYDENRFGTNEVETWGVIIDSFLEHNDDADKAK